MTTPNFLSTCVFLLFVLEQGSCSIGDRSGSFQECRRNCIARGDVSDTLGTLESLLQWTLTEECDYQCTRRDSVQRTEIRGGSPVQYYGCWSFQRVLGLEELGSVIFSAIQLALHVRGGLQTCTRCFSPGSTVRRAWWFFVVVWVNAWFWSMAYHARHKHTLMVLDYMSAQLAMVGALYLAAIYCIPLIRHAIVVPFTVALIVLYGLHVYHMLWVHFDYGWNMKVGIFIFISHHVIWAQWFLRGPFTKARRCAMAFVFCVTAAGVFEVYDFPPIIFETTDAHALWHASAIPATILWYQFAKCHTIHPVDDTRWSI